MRLEVAGYVSIAEARAAVGLSRSGFYATMAALGFERRGWWRADVERIGRDRGPSAVPVSSLGVEALTAAFTAALRAALPSR